MAGIKLSDVRSGARLLSTLAQKADYDGDGSLTSWDVGRASRGPSSSTPKSVATTRPKKPKSRTSTTPAAPKPKPAAKPAPAGKPSIDLVTQKALTAAVNRAKAHSQSAVEQVQVQINDARDKLLALDLDKDGKISDAELKKLKPDGKALAQALAAFAVEHAGDKASDFKFSSQHNDGVWQPKYPFKAPANATPAELATKIAQYYDARSNDNRWPGMISRWVLGPEETQGVVSAIDALSPAVGKKVLKELSAQIKSATVPRPYVHSTAVKYLDALAHKLGVSYDFVGVEAAPHFDGY